MGVITGIPKSLQPEPERVVQATPDKYKGVTVDTQFNPTDSFTTFVGGYPITVDYYAQRFSSKEGAKDYQKDLEAVYQPYKLIRGLEIVLTGNIDRNQDTTTKEFEINGNALCYSVFRPTEGDVFTFDLGDGAEYLFHVTSSKRETENSRSVTSIDFVAVAKMSQIDADRLNERIVETLYFDKDYMRRGFNPLLRPDQVEHRNRLEDHYAVLLDMFLTRFYSRNEKTLLVPGQSVPTYDPFLTEYFTRLVAIDEYPRTHSIELLDVVQRQDLYTKTLWTVLERMEPGYLPYTTRKCTLVSTKEWRGGPVLGGIYFTRVRQCVFPLELNSYVDSYNEPGHRLPDGTPLKPGVSSKLVSTGKMTLSYGAMTADVTEPNLDGFHAELPPVPKPVSLPDFVPVTVDDNYVLSSGFYNNQPQSILEQLTLQAIAGKQMSLEHLSALCEAIHQTTPLEQYYYIPVLLTLIRIHPRGY